MDKFNKFCFLGSCLLFGIIVASVIIKPSVIGAIVICVMIPNIAISYLTVKEQP